MLLVKATCWLVHAQYPCGGAVWWHLSVFSRNACGDFSSHFSKFHLNACRDLQNLINWSGYNSAGKRHIRHRVLRREKIVSYQLSSPISSSPHLMSTGEYQVRCEVTQSRDGVESCLLQSQVSTSSVQVSTFKEVPNFGGNLLHSTCRDPANMSPTHSEAKYQYCTTVWDSS